jgi:hypothetical protein
VTWDKATHKWAAEIRVTDKRTRPGRFDNGFQVFPPTWKSFPEFRCVLGAERNPPSPFWCVHFGHSPFSASADSRASLAYCLSALADLLAGRSVSCHCGSTFYLESRRRTSPFIYFADYLLQEAERAFSKIEGTVGSEKAEPQCKEVISEFAAIRPESVASVTEVRNFPEADFRGSIRAAASRCKRPLTVIVVTQAAHGPKWMIIDVETGGPRLRVQAGITGLALIADVLRWCCAYCKQT